MLDYLVEWAFEGLKIEKALEQPLTAYKVRHLKMGVRVVAAFCCCDKYIAFRMLVSLTYHKNKTALFCVNIWKIFFLNQM